MLRACLWGQETTSNWLPLQIEWIFFEWISIHIVTKTACSRVISRLVTNIFKIHNLDLRRWIITLVSSGLFINLWCDTTVFVLNEDSILCLWGWPHSDMLCLTADIIAPTFLPSSLRKQSRAFALWILIALDYWLAHALTVREPAIENNYIRLFVTIIIIIFPLSFWTLL